MRKKCYSDREKLLKFKAKGWEFEQFLELTIQNKLEQFNSIWKMNSEFQNLISEDKSLVFIGDDNDFFVNRKNP